MKTLMILAALSFMISVGACTQNDGNAHKQFTSPKSAVTQSKSPTKGSAELDAANKTFDAADQKVQALAAKLGVFSTVDFPIWAELDGTDLVTFSDNFSVPSEKQIDVVFNDLVKDKGNLDQYHDVDNDNFWLGLFNTDMKKMTQMGDAFLELLRADYTNTPYNQALYQYYLMTWLSYCDKWSGNDHSNCPANMTERKKLVDLHKKNYDDANLQIHKDLSDFQQALSDRADAASSVDALTPSSEDSTTGETAEKPAE